MVNLVDVFFDLDLLKNKTKKKQQIKDKYNRVRVPCQILLCE